MVRITAADRVWQLLSEIHDPEIPALSIVEMGLVRSLGIQEGKAIILLTPTFSACPAIRMIEQAILARLSEAGVPAEVRLVYSPPWSSNWIGSTAREKLKAFGIAPPPIHNGRLEDVLAQPVSCPYCNSQETVLKNDFGPTLCRSIYFCDSCQQPFEQFKPV